MRARGIAILAACGLIALSFFLLGRDHAASSRAAQALRGNPADDQKQVLATPGARRAPVFGASIALPPLEVEKSANAIPEGGLTGPRWPGDPAWTAQLAAAAVPRLALPTEPGAITEQIAVQVAQSSPRSEERQKAIAWLGRHAGPQYLVLLEQIANRSADPDVQHAGLEATGALRSRFRAAELPDGTEYPPDVAAAMAAAASAR